MRIDKNIQSLLVFKDETILNALSKISANNCKIVFVVEYSGVVIGSVTDGDVRRWITNGYELNLNQSIDKVMNKHFISLRQDTTPSTIEKSFRPGCDFIPLIDQAGRFVAIARKVSDGLILGERVISKIDPVFIIAEIGNNHNGNIELAYELVRYAIEAGADCVKFQMRDIPSLYNLEGNNSLFKLDLSVQYTLDMLTRFQLENKDLFCLFDYCQEMNIIPLCTPWDLNSLYELESYGIKGYKIASADLTNHELLSSAAKTKKPLICSTGMSSEFEIKSAISLLREEAASFSLLHCNSTYPTPFKDVNLSYMKHLEQISGAIVGYSGHERGIEIPIAAVALGARIVEKHITIDKNLTGPDHKVSLLPNEFAQMVASIRNVEQSIGNDSERSVTQGEMINRESLSKSLVATSFIKSGSTVNRDQVCIKSPGQGLSPNRLNELLGKKMVRDLGPGDFFYESDLCPPKKRKFNYKFTRPYGIPVRYHDYDQLTKESKLDFVEFHISYHDLNLNPSEIIAENSFIEFSVHSPELFANEHIMDLASDNHIYRRCSIDSLKRVVDTTHALMSLFPRTRKPLLVINVGGWSPNQFLKKTLRGALYEKVKLSLDSIDFGSVVPAIQTMPPFPWHFGGQSHHNIFVDPIEIKAFSQKTGYGICLDTSHSMMACNYYSWDFVDFLDTVLPSCVHLHIVDAIGIDGEGIQIGKGDIPFEALKNKVIELAPGIPFIPEVWQGHKNAGEGFWEALDFLEELGI